MTKQIIPISGMTCSGCEGSVVRIASELPGFINGKADKDNGTLLLEVKEKISHEQIKTMFNPFPKYSIGGFEEQKQNSNSYYPLYLVFGFIFVVSVLTSIKTLPLDFTKFDPKMFLHHFMTGFFLVFSFFKLLDVKAFASSFKMYDILGKKSSLYAHSYPFIELGLGLSCLVFPFSNWVYIIDIIIMSIGIVGVLNSILNKQEIQCACLGTVFALPMSKLTIIENSIMILVGILLWWL